MALSDLLGIELVESTPEKYVTRMLVTENMLQPHGVLHGGISAALAEMLQASAAPITMTTTRCSSWALRFPVPISFP